MQYAKYLDRVFVVVETDAVVTQTQPQLKWLDIGQALHISVAG